MKKLRQDKSTANERFPRRCRLLRSGDFERVYRRRIRASDELLIVHGLQNEIGITRLGLSVPRRIGGAVARNRWKRLLREAFRRSRDALPEGLDLVVSPRGPGEPTFEEVAGSLMKLASKLDRKLDRKES